GEPGALGGGGRGGGGGGALVGRRDEAGPLDARLADAGDPRQRGERVVPGRVAGQFEVHGIAAQLALELVGGARDHYPAAVHDCQAAGQVVRFLQVVGGEQD